MSRPRLSTIALAGSLAVFGLMIVAGPVIEERVRESHQWNQAYLLAPFLQIIFATIAIRAVLVSRRRGRRVESVVGMLVVLLFTAMVVYTGVSKYNRYSVVRHVGTGWKSGHLNTRCNGAGLRVQFLTFASASDTAPTTSRNGVSQAKCQPSNPLITT
jgi:hypothetical protein